MLKNLIQFLATIIVSIFVGFYVFISLPTIETFFAPVIVKTTYSTERVEEGTLISFDGLSFGHAKQFPLHGRTMTLKADLLL